MTGLKIRPARPTDAGRTGEILSEFTDATEWLPQVHSRAEHVGFAGTMIDRGWVTVAELGGRVIGFLARDVDTVHALYVGAEARGRGIGAALLQAQQANCNRLELWTFQNNTAAQAFYRRHGFSEAERTGGAGNDEGLPDIRFVWERVA